jgi:hypothetical protein
MAKKAGSHKLFNRAYHKATLIQPGQASTLTPEEHDELMRYLYPRPHPGQVPCTKCGAPTIDKDREKPARCAPGVRICGVCCWHLLKEQHAVL